MPPDAVKRLALASAAGRSRIHQSSNILVDPVGATIAINAAHCTPPQGNAM